MRSVSPLSRAFVVAPAVAWCFPAEGVAVATNNVYVVEGAGGPGEVVGGEVFFGAAVAAPGLQGACSGAEAVPGGVGAACACAGLRGLFGSVLGAASVFAWFAAFDAELHAAPSARMSQFMQVPSGRRRCSPGAHRTPGWTVTIVVVGVFTFL